MDATDQEQQSNPSNELNALWEGLQKDPKQISPKWFYDALGSALFTAITRLPEYYPTRCEMSMLEDPTLETWAELPSNAAVVELGSGNAEKILCLLKHVRSPRSYHPVDVSHAAIEHTLRPVNAAYPDLHTSALHGDFTDTSALTTLLASVRADSPTIVFFPGSTIGNFDPGFAKSLLTSVAQGCAPGSVMLLGADLVKGTEALLPAYNDAVGVTAAFNRNALAHLNRALQTTFDPTTWRHEARFNAQHKRVEMWLVCQSAQTVKVGERQLEFGPGDEIRTECSHKYDREQISALIADTGWRLGRIVPDRSGRFAQVLLQV